MKTETIKASSLNQTFVGLKAIITMADGTQVAGGISDIRWAGVYPASAPVGSIVSGVVMIYISGRIVVLGCENTLEVEMTPTQVEAEADVGIPLGAGRVSAQEAASALENYLAIVAVSAASQMRLPDRHFIEEPNGDTPRTGHVFGFLLTSTIMVAAAAVVLKYGLSAAPLSGHTLLAMALLTMIAGLALQVLRVSRTVQRWVL